MRRVNGYEYDPALDTGDGGPITAEQRRRALRSKSLWWRLRRRMPRVGAGDVTAWIIRRGAGVKAMQDCGCKSMQAAMNRAGWFKCWKHRRAIIDELKRRADEADVAWRPWRTLARAVFWPARIRSSNQEHHHAEQHPERT